MVRRFGAVASAASPLSAGVSAAEAAERVEVAFDFVAVVDRERLGRLAVAGSALSAIAGASSADGAVAAALARVVRRFGAAVSAWASGLAAPVVVVLVEVRRVRVFGAADAVSATAWAGSTAGSARDGDSDAGRGPAFPDCASCARSTASSSSGTSLHGSLDE